MRQRFLVLLAFVLTSSVAFATAQRPDRLVYEGQTYALNSNPLGQYFAEHPERHPIEATDAGQLVTSTGLWRGYVATFALEDDLLVLRDFEVLRPSDDPEAFGAKLVSEIDTFFETPESRVLSWYSGIMVVPRGEMIHYVHLGYASVYDSYMLLRVESGRVIEIAMFDANEFLDFKRRQFAVFRESDEYRKLIEYYAGEEDYDREFMDQFIFDSGGFVESVMIEFREPDQGKDEKGD